MYHPLQFSPGERCRKDSSSSGNGEYGYHQTSTSRSSSGHKVREVLNSIFPPGVVNVIVGSSPDIGAALVDSSDVNMISFTGSSMVGAKIMESGGKTMKRLLMELGGKGALIMTEDCDIQQLEESLASGDSTVAKLHSTHT